MKQLFELGDREFRAYAVCPDQAALRKLLVITLAECWKSCPTGPEAENAGPGRDE